MSSRIIPLNQDTAMVISHNRDGKDTIPLPANDETVELVMFKGFGLAYINAKSCYSSKHRYCKTDNELAKELTKLKLKTCSSKNASSKALKVRKDSNSELSKEVKLLEHLEPELKKMNLDEFREYSNVKAKNGVAFDEETGEVTWRYRPIKSLKCAWLKQSYYLFNSTHWETLVGVTVHLDTFPTFGSLRILQTHQA